jgi:flagellar motor switch protein FliM
MESMPPLHSDSLCAAAPENAGLALLLDQKTAACLEAGSAATRRIAACLAAHVPGLLFEGLQIEAETSSLLLPAMCEALLQKRSASLHAVEIKLSEAVFHIVIPLELTRRLTDQFFGGSAKNNCLRTPVLSTAETLFLERFLQGLLRALQQSVPQVSGLALTTAGVAYLPDTVCALLDCPEYLNNRLALHLDKDFLFHIDMLFPAALLTLFSAPSEHPALTSLQWQQRRDTNLEDMTIELRAILARPTLSVAQLLALAPGETIILDTPDLIDLCVGDQIVGAGKPGQMGSGTAVQITRNNFAHKLN